MILRLRAAFSALTSDRVRRVIIAGRRAGALSRVLGSSGPRVLGSSGRERWSLRRRRPWRPRASAGPAVAGFAAPDRVRRPAMASSRRRSVLGSATRSGLDNEASGSRCAGRRRGERSQPRPRWRRWSWSGRLARPVSLAQRMRSPGRGGGAAVSGRADAGRRCWWRSR